MAKRFVRPIALIQKYLSYPTHEVSSRYRPSQRDPTPNRAILCKASISDTIASFVRIFSLCHYEPLRHMVFGSAVAVQNTIKLLHRLNYAEPNEWSKLIPTDKNNEVMAVLTKKVKTN